MPALQELGLQHLIATATQATQATVLDPGLGASVPTPPTAVLIAAWILGMVALAILWAFSRR